MSEPQSAAFPVRFQGRAVAALAVYAPENDAFGIEELRLLDEVAGDLSRLDVPPALSELGYRRHERK